VWRPTVVDHAQPQLFSADENRSAQVNFSVPPTAMPKNKRMDAFSRDAFKFGALSGFRHFRTDLRGREELLVTVWPGEPSAAGEASSPPSRRPALRPMDDATVPPASPCSRERPAQVWASNEPPPHATFLVGGYAHYNCPYVWVREGHGLLGSFASEASFDAPLQLQSVAAWPSRTVYVWEIVAELVQAVVRAPPSNPFELAPGVAAAFASQRPASDAMLASAALAHFLRELYLSRSQFSRAVEGDYLDVVEAHVRLLPPLAASLNDDRRSASFGGSVSGESPARGGGSMIS
jgi:hypothetical protein